MKNRAYRRHQENRIKRRVVKYYDGWPNTDRRATGVVAHSRQVCSCWMCGNPRRYFKEESLQERRWTYSERMELPEGIAEDGLDLTVLGPEGESTFTLLPDEVRLLQNSIDQASRGEVVDGWTLLEDLRG